MISSAILNLRSLLLDAMGLGFSRAESAQLAAWLVLALAELHQAGRAHGDLKPENVLVDARGGVRLVDLEFSGAPGARQGGTAGYCAPEAGSPAADPRRADLWSLGVIVHELLCGARPGAEDRSGTWPRLRGTAPDWVGLVDALVRIDASRRPSSAVEAREDLPGAEPSGDLGPLVREAADQKLAGLLSAHAERLVRRSRGAEAMPLLQEALDLDPDQTQALEILPRVRVAAPNRSWILVAATAVACAAAVVAWRWRDPPPRTPMVGGTGAVRERILVPRDRSAGETLPLRQRNAR